MCAGAELLLLPGCGGGLPDRLVSGSGRLVKISIFLLYYRYPDFIGGAAGTVYLRLSLLLIMVVLLPALVVNEMGMGDPFFCKYLCPQGVLEGAIPLSLTNAGIRAALGKLFSWKFCILLAVVVASVVFYRPFCKWLCPLGAFYAVMNRVSLFQMRVDTDKCVSCGACARACKMDVDITKTPNHAECIRCGMCIKSCPTKAIHYQYGFGDKADNSKEI